MIDPSGLPGFSRRHGLLLRQGIREPARFALIEDRLPTARESRAIARHDYGLHLLKSVRAEQGAEVVALLPHLEHLMITGIDMELRWIERLTNLRSLTINGTIESPADLSRLPSLLEYAGTLRGAESVFHAPQITAIAVDDVRDGTLPAIPAQLTRLSLTDLQGVRALAPQNGDPLLEHLSLTGARHFDTASLRPFHRLRSIELTQVSMIHIDALGHLPLLETLALESCGDLDPIESLTTLTKTRIDVWGRGKFATKMKDLAGNHAHWQFH